MLNRDVYVPVLGFASACLALRLIVKRYWRAPTPPGPKGWPLIGNVFDMPKSQEWRTFDHWGDVYGDVVSVNMVGQHLVILNSLKAATDLLENRGSIYSDRPRLVMGGELVGWNVLLAFCPYNDSFRVVRKILHNSIGSTHGMEPFLRIEEEEARKFIRRVRERPDRIAEDIRKTAGAIILRITYGYHVNEGQDPMVDLVETAIAQFSVLTTPGAFLVDSMPILKYVPSWMPGAGFKRLAREWGTVVHQMADTPIGYVKRQVAAGTAEPSLTSRHLEDPETTPSYMDSVKWAAAAVYAGGADTTVSVLNTFYLVMTLYPDIQRRAQAEVDAVCGDDRLPTFNDRERMPYVNAIVKELFRWNPVGPLGLPHCVREEDIYNGYRIPKGSIVIANIWRFLHDPEVYHDPMTFNPDRYLGSKLRAAEPDPQALAFGFGRRSCPGLNVADTFVWINVAMSLAVFDVAKPVVDGKVVEPTVEYSSGTVSHPKPFQCAITPRSSKTEHLILHAADGL